MKVLFVVSSHGKLGDTGRATGTWLEEFIAPYYELTDQGVHVSLASPLGGAMPIDPLSIEAIASTDLFKRYEADEDLNKIMSSVQRLETLDHKIYDAVVYPGGHGPLYDLRKNTSSIRLIEEMLASEKSVATICHAGCVLLDALAASGSPLVAGRSLTAFSNSEEQAVGLDQVVPYLVESILIEQGADYTKAEDWHKHVVIDGGLITGQNPASAVDVARAVFSRHQNGLS